MSFSGLKTPKPPAPSQPRFGFFFLQYYCTYDVFAVQLKFLSNLLLIFDAARVSWINKASGNEIVATRIPVATYMILVFFFFFFFFFLTELCMQKVRFGLVGAFGLD